MKGLSQLSAILKAPPFQVLRCELPRGSQSPEAAAAEGSGGCRGQPSANAYGPWPGSASPAPRACACRGPSLLGGSALRYSQTPGELHGGLCASSHLSLLNRGNAVQSSGDVTSISTAPTRPPHPPGSRGNSYM